jgi:Na+/proline symporter
MILLNVFSKPLHISEAFQWVLMIGAFVPIGLIFYFTKVAKREKAQGAGTGQTDVTPVSAELERKKKMKKNLWLGMALGCLVGLCAPLWLPLTGTTLGPKGDFVVGLITVAICCTIVGLRLRKL